MFIQYSEAVGEGWKKVLWKIVALQQGASHGNMSFIYTRKSIEQFWWPHAVCPASSVGRASDS